MLQLALTVIFSLLALLFLALAIFAVAGVIFRLLAARRPHLSLIEIAGPIGVDSGPMQAGFSVQKTLWQLSQARESGRVKGVLLRINSPGGTVGATQELAMELARLRQVKPVVVSVQDMALSGGFWLAMQGSEVWAPPGAEFGSIGVIMAKPNLKGLYEKLGVSRDTVKSADHKDFMSSSRGWDEVERAFLGELNRELFDQFVQAVARARQLDEGEIRALADGRVFSATFALERRLIDRIGNLPQAADRLRELCGVGQKAPLRGPRRSLLRRLTG